jgi:hypothetical protein
MTPDEQHALEVEQGKGRMAQGVADSVEPYFVQAKENLVGKFLRSNPNDSEVHTAIRRQIEAVDAVWALIKTDVDTGKLASKALEH